VTVNSGTGNNTGTWTMSCAPGKKILGGGFAGTESNAQNLMVGKSAPFVTSNSGYGWIVEVKNPTSSPITFTIYAICATALP
jgi:hypothetical protein